MRLCLSLPTSLTLSRNHASSLQVPAAAHHRPAASPLSLQQQQRTTALTPTAAAHRPHANRSGALPPSRQQQRRTAGLTASLNPLRRQSAVSAHGWQQRQGVNVRSSVQLQSHSIRPSSAFVRTLRPRQSLLNSSTSQPVSQHP